MMSLDKFLMMRSTKCQTEQIKALANLSDEEWAQYKVFQQQLKRFKDEDRK